MELQRERALIETKRISAQDDRDRTGLTVPLTALDRLDLRHHQPNIPSLDSAGGPTARPPRRSEFARTTPPLSWLRSAA